MIVEYLGLFSTRWGSFYPSSVVMMPNTGRKDDDLQASKMTAVVVRDLSSRAQEQNHKYTYIISRIHDLILHS